MDNYFKDKVEEIISQEFRLKKTYVAKNYFVQETKQNELMSKMYKKVCMTQNYIGHFLILASVVTGYDSNSAFVFLLGTPIGITSSAIGLKICSITAGINNHKSIIKKTKKIG